MNINNEIPLKKTKSLQIPLNLFLLLYFFVMIINFIIIAISLTLQMPKVHIMRIVLLNHIFLSKKMFIFI